MTETINLNGIRMSNEESNRLTRECLCTALMKLLCDRTLEELSINQIVELAGVSRMAFYRNYGNKETLAEDLWMHLAKELERDLKEGFEVEDKETWYIHFFETMSNNKDYLKILLSRHIPVNVRMIVGLLFPMVSTEEHYFYMGRGGALFYMLNEWYSSGMKESPTEMGAICNRFFSKFRI